MADALDLRDRFSDLATAGNLNEALTLVRAVVRASRSDVLIRCAAVQTLWLCPRSDLSCMPLYGAGNYPMTRSAPCSASGQHTEAALCSRLPLSHLQAQTQAFPATGG